jgi:hypothetical protein
MSLYYGILFLIFAIIAVMIVIDPNVGDYITLIIRFIGIQLQRLFWMIKYHPNNFITTWIQNQKYDRISRQLREELDKKNKT